MTHTGKRRPQSVEALRVRVNRWRRTRWKRSPMPADLWEAAVGLARKHGLSVVAREAGLDYGALKRRVDGSGAGRDDRDSATGGGFVELSGSQIIAARAPAGCVVEISRADGARMTIRVVEKLDVAGLAEAFCRERER